MIAHYEWDQEMKLKLAKAPEFEKERLIIEIEEKTHPIAYYQNYLDN